MTNKRLTKDGAREPRTFRTTTVSETMQFIRNFISDGHQLAVVQDGREWVITVMGVEE